MRLKELDTIAAVEWFLAGTQDVAFSVASNKNARYSWGIGGQIPISRSYSVAESGDKFTYFFREPTLSKKGTDLFFVQRRMTNL